MQVFYDKDCDLDIIKGKKVAIIGYGSQGHAHACNLQESGVDVTVGLRSGSSSIAKAEAHGLKVTDIPEAVAAADLVMILTPDEFHKQLYTTSIAPNIRQDATLAFAHGFSVLYKRYCLPTGSLFFMRPGLGRIMIRPLALQGTLYEDCGYCQRQCPGTRIPPVGDCQGFAVKGT